MQHIRTRRRIRTHDNIRTRCSLVTSTGPGHVHWPRLKETEQLKRAEKHLLAGVRRAWR